MYVHQGPRIGYRGVRMAHQLYGLETLDDDKLAARTFIWSVTDASRAKFQFRDRIHKDDVASIVASISAYISTNSGWSPSDLNDRSAHIFQEILVPPALPEHDKNNGYRLNEGTLNTAGDAIGQSIFEYRASKPTGIFGSGGAGFAVVTQYLTNPLVLIAAAGSVYLLWRNRKRLGALRGYSKRKRGSK